jgi:cardiolipin synthase
VPSLAPAASAWPEWCYPANLLTELRLLAIPAILATVVEGQFGWAVTIFAAAAVSDGLDGFLARRFNQRSRLGAYLDPIADKALLTALFLALALVGHIPWALAILVFTRDASILVSALVLVAATRFRDFHPTWWGKAETTAELATIGVSLLNAWRPNGAVLDIEKFGWAAVATLIIVSGVDYAFTAARRFHSQNANAG